MRFLRMQIVAITSLVLSTSMAVAAVGNFNGLIQGASMDEKSLHQRVLE